MRRRRRDIDGMKTTLIYSTNEIVKVSIPTLAITLLNVLLRSMTIDIIIPAIDKRKNPILKPSKARWFVLASIACPAAKYRSFCASVVAAAYWLLRESIENGLFVARKTATPVIARIKASVIQLSLARLMAT